MVDLATIHDTVSSALARGSTLNTVIPARVRMAARWIERNHTYQYMRRYGTVEVDHTVDRPDVVALPSEYWKSLPLIRWRFASSTSDNSYIYQKLERQSDVFALSQANGIANGYSLDGTRNILLNAVPQATYTLEIFWVAFTDWPTDLDSTNWLTENAEDLLLAQTVLLSGIFQRDPRMLEFYKSMRDEALKTTLDADYEMDTSGSGDSMIFTPPGGLDWAWDDPQRLVP